MTRASKLNASEKRWAHSILRRGGRGGVAVAAIAEHIGRREAATRNALLALVEDGLVAVTGGDRFALTAKGQRLPGLTRSDPDW